MEEGWFGRAVTPVVKTPAQGTTAGTPQSRFDQLRKQRLSFEEQWSVRERDAEGEKTHSKRLSFDDEWSAREQGPGPAPKDQGIDI